MTFFDCYFEEAYQIKINHWHDFGIVEVAPETDGAHRTSNPMAHHLLDLGLPLATTTHLMGTYAAKSNPSIQNFDDTSFNRSLDSLIIFCSACAFFSSLCL